MARDLASNAYEQAFKRVLQLIEGNIVPDFVVRAGIRHLLSQRAVCSTTASGEEYEDRLASFINELKQMPIAINTRDANEQHYEVPTDYFLRVLGSHLKYSSCYYSMPGTGLDEAEEAMLALCSQRAELADGQSILELGCGWGSWCLYNAEKYPNAKITAVSNSKTQKAHIDAVAHTRGLKNVTIITADMVEFNAEQIYDRVVSVEMFEHMKNYDELLRRISTWLVPGGKLFVHIFVHRKGLPYHYEVESEADWMTKYFFSGGTMPSMDLLLHFQNDMAIERQWYVNGTHYSRTLEAWLAKHDTEKSAIMDMFATTYGRRDANTWFVRWRLFYLACSELFAYDGGERWGLGHYRFVKKKG